MFTLNIRHYLFTFKLIITVFADVRRPPSHVEGGQHSIDIARKRPPGKALEKIVAKGLINKVIRTLEFTHSRRFNGKFHCRGRMPKQVGWPTKEF